MKVMSALWHLPYHLRLHVLAETYDTCRIFAGGVVLGVREARARTDEGVEVDGGVVLAAIAFLRLLAIGPGGGGSGSQVEAPVEDEGQANEEEQGKEGDERLGDYGGDAGVAEVMERGV